MDALDAAGFRFHGELRRARELGKEEKETQDTGEEREKEEEKGKRKVCHYLLDDLCRPHRSRKIRALLVRPQTQVA